MGGYIGSKRSVRSQQALDSFEVPLSSINKSLVHEFLYDNEDHFDLADFQLLLEAPIYLWKYAAEKRLGATSWHHTGAHFARTDHYDLCLVAELLIDNKDGLMNDYKDDQRKDIAPSSATFAVALVQVWGGSRRKPRLVGQKKIAGVLLKGWIYCKEDHDLSCPIERHKSDAKKIIWLKEYASYADLVKQHSDFVGTKRVFNALLKEKGGM